MNAIVYRQYGSPEVLGCEEVETPVPGEREVLIRVRAASVNPLDWHFMRGLPYPLRAIAGLTKPKNPRLGVDAAGEVEAVGKNVTEFKQGDTVFGMCKGAFAEYACAAVSAVVMKPANISFEQAASVPIAGLSALQGLRDKGKIRPGHKVLINGAAGGVGTFAVQIARSLGGKVTGVCSTKNAEMVRSLGADRVIDYTRDDFTRSAERYDILYDCIGNHSLSAFRRVLTPNGICVMIGGKSDPWMIGTLALSLAALGISALGNRKLVSFLAKRSAEDLTTLAGLIASGKVTPVIEKRFPLSETADAIRFVEAGHARGKVIITM